MRYSDCMNSICATSVVDDEPILDQPEIGISLPLGDI